MTIVAVGDVSLDLALRLDRLPEPDEKLVVTESVEGLGGVVANFAVGAARLGASVRLSARLGDDVAGRAALADLNTKSLDLTAVRVEAGAGTYRTVSLLDASGEKRLLLLPAESLYPRAEELSAALLDGARWAHTAPYDHRACRRLLDLSAEAGIPASIDLEPATIDADTGHMGALLDGADTVFVNERALALLAGDAEAGYRLLHTFGVHHVVHTQGPLGATLASADGSRAAVRDLPSVTVIDTTGAGDAFAAGYVVARCNGATPLEAVRTAVIVGALACRGLGAQGSLARPDDIPSHLRPVIGAPE